MYIVYGGIQKYIIFWEIEDNGDMCNGCPSPTLALLNSGNLMPLFHSISFWQLDGNITSPLLRMVKVWSFFLDYNEWTSCLQWKGRKKGKEITIVENSEHPTPAAKNNTHCTRRATFLNGAIYLNRVYFTSVLHIVVKFKISVSHFC